jgi:G3E family GTPase
VGKTTFANLLLDYYIRKGEKTAYIVNEFGKAGVDSALIAQKGFQTIDIVGGCICCTLRGKISEAVFDVVTNFSPDRIVFEPSGIFIFEKFQAIIEEPSLHDKCEIDSVITVVDSTHATDAMFVPGNFFANQVAHADTLILSKLQLYKGDALKLVERLRVLNDRAGIWAKPWDGITEEDFAALDFGGSIGIGADDDDDEEEDHEHEHGHHHHDHHHHHGHHHHDEHDDDDEEEMLHEELDSITIPVKDLDSAALDELRKLMKDGVFGNVYRAKGRVMHNGQPKLLQAVFDSLNLDDNPPDGECSLTFIGKDLSESKITEHWGK